MVCDLMVWDEELQHGRNLRHLLLLSNAALADRAVLLAACVQLQCCCLSTTLSLEPWPLCFCIYQPVGGDWHAGQKKWTTDMQVGIRLSFIKYCQDHGLRNQQTKCLLVFIIPNEVWCLRWWSCQFYWLVTWQILMVWFPSWSFARWCISIAKNICSFLCVCVYTQ